MPDNEPLMPIGVVAGDIHYRCVSNSLSYVGIKSIRMYPWRFFDFLSKLRKVGAIYLVYSPVYEILSPLFFLFLRIARKPILVHWIGSDVLQCIGSLPARLIGLIVGHLAAANLAGAPWLVAELGQIGIKAIQVPIVPYLRQVELPLPEDFHVLVYLPTSQEAQTTHNTEAIKRILRSLPTIKFIIVGGAEISGPNVENLGFRQAGPDLYCRCSVLLRLPIHDGLSLMVLEALGFGRYCIYAYPFPHCIHLTKPEEATQEILKLASVAKPNSEGHRFVTGYFNPKRTGVLMKSIICSVMKTTCARMTAADQ